MTSVLRICRKCAGEIAADAPEGFCPACLLETGLGFFAEDEIGEPAEVISAPRAGISDRTPTDFGDYELLEEIGRGGQGVVFRARQKSLNRLVALKVIGLGQWATKTHLKRFRLEAEAAARLSHPSIVPIYEIGERDGSCYFSMGLVEGGQLDEVVRREPIPVRRAVELIAKLARTIHYAHERGILHRDIKPGNILLDARGEPHLTDFGLARLVETESTVTRTHDVMGTPSYMAPEQAAGKTTALTAATDVYGLGAVFYQLLTGHPPFLGRTTYETVRLVLESEPRQPRAWNPKIDRDLATISLKCLEKNPERRYLSALALAEDLERWLRHEPILARHTGPFTWAGKWVRRNSIATLLVASLVALVAAVSVIVWKSAPARRPPAAGIAVLPFENLSSNKEDASFADGVQDDILTKLARIADLKVISRSSVMKYRGERNMRQIGDALRVTHVLEGSVRKTGASVHVNAQLIDTRTDAHIWAQQYDRDLNDAFAIQSEIAKEVAEQLHARISPAEKLALERPPTADLAAFDLYPRGKNLLLMTSYSSSAKAYLLEASSLLNQAVRRDPSFLQAWCQLAQSHEQLYFFGFDHTHARLELAEAATEAAFHLRPDAGEAHLARAENLYRGHLDYDGALAELEVAGQSLPNDPKVFALKGYIQRRQGKQNEALRNLERSADLDPGNVFTLQQIALSSGFFRHYAEEKSVLDRALNIEPNDNETRVARALVELDWKADPRPLHQTIDSIRATDFAATPAIADGWLMCALAERDARAAKDALIALGEAPLSASVVHLSHPVIEGLIARMLKEDGKARSAFAAARAIQEKVIQAQPNYGPPLCVLGLIDAGLGRKEEALREGRRAVELLPVEKDAINGPIMVVYFAMIAAWAGEKDLACEELARAIRYPNFLSYGHLRLLPFWDPLRGDPRFEKIVASLAPKG
jgi:TolB-like protein/Flp pilus assembly protein TadD